MSPHPNLVQVGLLAWQEGWMLLWSASLMLQVLGLSISTWQWWTTSVVLWRLFWLVFTLNWVFTVIHQVTWGVLGHDLHTVAGCLQGLLKLGAMLSELFVMLVARQVARCCQPPPLVPDAAEPSR